MSDEPRYVTRREYYSTIGGIYTLFGVFAVSVSTLYGESWQSIIVLILAVAAILAGLAYSIMAVREKSPPRRSDAASPPSPRGPD